MATERKKPTAKKRVAPGRPKAVIDWGRVDKLLKAQCDGVGIAGILGIHEDTLYKACEEVHKMGFTAYKQQKQSEGREILRETMYDNAISGEKSLQIWLSKQYLGMSEKQEVEHSGNISAADMNMADAEKVRAELRKKLGANS
jgi:hypothetical protein